MKRLAKTHFLEDRLSRSLEPGTNTSDLVIFEATLANTKPLRKKHPLYSGARLMEDILDSMEEVVNRESIPLMMNHGEVNGIFGRVFYGEKRGQEFRALFFMNEKVNEKEVSLIESGVVDQVSVAILTKNVLCSECGFDFRGSEATFEHILSGTCPNGHKLGVDAYAKLTNLENWNETSLVPRGAVQGAKIHSPYTSKLLADGRIESLFVLEALMEDNDMELVEKVIKEGLEKVLTSSKSVQEKILEKIQELTNIMQDIESRVEEIKNSFYDKTEKKLKEVEKMEEVEEKTKLNASSDPILKSQLEAKVASKDASEGHAIGAVTDVKVGVHLKELSAFKVRK